jgi:hypothetical protein
MTSLDPIAYPNPSELNTFRTWRKAFERLKREQPALEQSFSRFTKAGCSRGELEWALFWVPLSHQSNVEWKSGQIQEEIKDFFALVDKILPKIANLRTALDTLLTGRSPKRPVIDAYASFLDHLFPALEIWQRRNEIRPIPGMLYELDMLLMAIRGLKGNLPTAAASEALLIEYVKKATAGKISLAQISSQMELACKAYGTEERQCTEEAVKKRYKRLKKADRKEFETIVSIVEQFVSRRSRGEPVSLIPFFIDSYISLGRAEVMRGK